MQISHLKLNKEKHNILVSRHKHENVWARIGQTKIWESAKQKLLGVVIGRSLNFNMLHHYVKTLEKKILCIRTIVQFCEVNWKTSTNEKNYIISVWMFHSWTVKWNINHFHESSLRIVDKDYGSFFEVLLRRDKSVTVNHRNILSLVIKLSKVNQNIYNSMLDIVYTT